MFASICLSQHRRRPGSPHHRRGARRRGPARVHHGRQRGRHAARGARPCAGRRPVERSVVAQPSDHRQLRAGRVRKCGTSLDLAVVVAVLVAAGEVPRESVEGLAFVGRWASTARCVGCPALRRWSRRCRDLAPVGARGRPTGGVDSHRTAGPHVDTVGPPRGGAAAATSPGRPGRAGRRVVRGVRPDLAEVRGQEVARTSLERSRAAGGHNLLLIGSPRQRQDDAGATAAGPSARPRRPDALAATMVHSAAGVPLPPEGMVRRARVPLAPSHVLARGHGGRRQRHPPAGRGEPRPWWRPLPRRTREFAPTFSTDCASRWRTGSSTSPRVTPRRPARPFPPRRCIEPVSVRRRALPCVRVCDETALGSLRAPHERAAARPYRPARRRQPTRRRPFMCWASVQRNRRRSWRGGWRQHVRRHSIARGSEQSLGLRRPRSVSPRSLWRRSPCCAASSRSRSS